ncbi:MAG: extracellular solute-binding protein, partial [Nannocystaceae bacterium]
MNRVTRWIRLALIASVYLLIGVVPAPATATSPPVKNPDSPLKLWHAYRGAEQATLDALLASFDGEVEVLAIPYDAFGAKIAASIPLGEGPDLFIDSHERLGDFIHRGLVAPLSAEHLNADAYVPQALDAVTLLDASGVSRPWAVPLSMKSLALYVNTDLLTEVPASLEDFAALTDTLGDG